MVKKISWFIKPLVIFGVILLSILFVYKNLGEIQQIRIVNPIYLLPIMILTIVFLITNGLISKIILDKQGVRLRFTEWFGLSVVGSMANYITPFRGGLFTNAVYLKKSHAYSYGKFISIIGSTYVLIFMVNSLCGLLALLWFYYSSGVFSALLFLVFLFLFIFCLFLLIIPLKLQKTHSNSYIQKVLNVINNLLYLRKNKRLIIKLLCLCLINVSIVSLINYFEFMMIGVELGIEKSIMLSVFSTYSLLLSITPGSLGIKESFMVYSGWVLSVPIASVAVISVVDRLITFVPTLLLGLFYSHKLMRHDTNRDVVKN